MEIQVDMENMSLFIQNDDELGTPLARVTLNKMRIAVTKRQYGMDINVFIQFMDGSFYYLKNNSIHETYLIGTDNEEIVVEIEKLIKVDQQGDKYVDIDLLDCRLQSIQNYFNELEEKGDKIVREAEFRTYDYDDVEMTASVKMMVDFMDVQLHFDEMNVML